MSMEKSIHTILLSEKKKWLVVISTLLLFVGSVLLLPYKIVLAKMLPGKDSDTFTVYVDLPEGSSRYQTRSVTNCVNGVLVTEEDISDIEVFLGQGSPLSFEGLIKGSKFKKGQHLAEIVVNLKKGDGRKEASYFLAQRLRLAIQSECQNSTNRANIKVVEPPAGPPTLSAIVAEIYGGNSYESRERFAQEIAEVFQNTKGLVDIDVLSEESHRVYELIPKSEKISRAELNLRQVNEILFMAFEGFNAAVKNEESAYAQIPIHVVLSDETRLMQDDSLTSLKNKLSEMRLVNQKGMLVPLIELVQVRESVNNPMIFSKNLKEMIPVVAETDMVSQVYPLLKARETMKRDFSDRYEVDSSPFLHLNFLDTQTGETFSLVWDGEMKVTIDTFIDLGGAFIGALVLIFLLMVVYYKSFALSGIVLLGSFLSIIGVILGHWLMDAFMRETFFLTATSLIGFIALIGINSRNSLLLIDFTHQLMKEGEEKKKAIAHAVKIRALPIFLTAATIWLASSLLATDAVFGGLGVALIFGSMAAVVVSLVVVPVLMDWAIKDTSFQSKHERTNYA